jgi:hypothetical protein
VFGKARVINTLGNPSRAQPSPNLAVGRAHGGARTVPREVGVADQINRAKAESQGLGLFVRSLVGLDREAAKEAMAGFLTGKTLTASQIEFVNLVVNHLTEHGVMDAKLLYERVRATAQAA